jgi:hypothetical protein
MFVKHVRLTEVAVKVKNVYARVSFMKIIRLHVENVI